MGAWRIAGEHFFLSCLLPLKILCPRQFRTNFSKQSDQIRTKKKYKTINKTLGQSKENILVALGNTDLRWGSRIAWSKVFHKWSVWHFRVRWVIRGPPQMFLKDRYVCVKESGPEDALPPNRCHLWFCMCVFVQNCLMKSHYCWFCSYFVSEVGH